MICAVFFFFFFNFIFIIYLFLFGGSDHFIEGLQGSMLRLGRTMRSNILCPAWISPPSWLPKVCTVFNNPSGHGVAFYFECFSFSLLYALSSYSFLKLKLKKNIEKIYENIQKYAFKRFLYYYSFKSKQ